jgi:hypothetical protein
MDAVSRTIGFRRIVTAMPNQPPPKLTDDGSSLRAWAPRLLAITAWCGVLLQLALSIKFALTGGKPVIDALVAYFGYFTILTNIFVALVCAAGALRQPLHARSWLYRPATVGCATAAILVVGIGYHWLLRDIWAPQGAQRLADIVLHYIVPVGALLHWLIYPNAMRLAWWAPLSWCWYPLAYFVYVMARGEILSAYPYPFIDVSVLGYTKTIVNSIAFLIGFIALGYAVLGLKRGSTDRLDSPRRPE